MNEPLILRDSARLVLSHYLTSVLPLLLGFAGLLWWVSTWVAPWTQIGTVAVVLMAVNTVLRPWVRLATVRYRISATGIEVVSGLISRRRDVAHWDQISALDEKAGLGHRLFRLTEVTVCQSGSGGAPLVLEALSAPALDALHRARDRDAPELAESAAGVPATPAGPDGVGATASPSPASSSHEPASIAVADSAEPASSVATESTEPASLVYAMTPRDMLFIAVVYGQVFLLVPPVYFALLEVTSWIGWSEAFESTVAQWAGNGWGLLGLILAGLGVGVAATALKYHRMQVWAQADGALLITYGLLATHRRRIDPRHVQGLQWQRGIVEQLTARTRLSVLSLDSADQLGSNLVLPSLPHATVREIVETHFPRYRDVAAVQDRSSTVLSAVMGLACVSGVVGGIWWLTAYVAHWWWWVAALLSLLGLAVTVRVGQILRTRLSTELESGLITARTRFLADRVTVLPGSSVHGTTSLTLRLGRRTSGPLLVAAHCYAGISTRFRALTASPAVLHQLTALTRTGHHHLRRAPKGADETLLRVLPGTTAPEPA
ncbi:MAG: PH domain-containing protein [Micrococcus sp.]|nr:PH domain-containing protein [Micrococcus sp.]